MKKTVLFIFMAALLAACRAMPDHNPGGVWLSVKVDGPVITRADVADVPALMEDNISGGLHIFISGHGVFLKYHLNSPVDGGVYFLSSDWKNAGVIVGATYDVYGIANSSLDASVVNSVDDLKSLICDVDTDIYRLYDPSAGTFELDKTNSKLFLMDGKTVWTPTDAAEQTIPLTLKRAAAKLEINFSLSSLMAEYSIHGTPQWKFVDYTASTPLLASGTSGSVATATTPLPMNVTSHTGNGGRIITYSYARSWTDPDDHVRILLNVPLKDASDSVIHNNWYSIPMADIKNGAPWGLERNTFYAIHVTLDSIGSSGETIGDHPVNLQYRVLDWEYYSVTDDVTVSGQEVSYLMVEPGEGEIREKVLADSFQLRELNLSFWASGDIVIGTPDIYYYDKYGTRVNIGQGPDLQINSEGYKSGTIRISSKALSNNAIKYIRFSVSLADNPLIRQEILVRHYPLDYIQNIEGKWSSLVSAGWVNWDTDQQPHTPRRTVSNSIFQAKVYNNGNIYRIVDNGSYYGGYSAAQGQQFTNLSNNRMYVVQITSTSDSYNVGRVVLDSNFQSQEHLVSPAFMIASQLGATQPTTNAGDAASQCGNYKEVAMDGSVYAGWRLPTREEIGIIMGYQYNSDAIAEVLSGSHYWTLEGKAVSKNTPSNTSSDNTSGYIRCVRDLTVADVRKINSKE